GGPDRRGELGGGGGQPAAQGDGPVAQACGGGECHGPAPVPVTLILCTLVTKMTRRQTPVEPPVRRDGRRERWTAHRAARRAELMEAVLQAVRQRGPGIDLDDVAAVSGIAKTVFYRYFADKADLFLAVGREAGERVVEEVVAAVDGTSHPRVMVQAGVDTFLRAVEADPEVYRFVLQRPANAAAASDYSAVISKHVSRVIGDLLRAAGRDTGRAEPWGFAMVGAVRSAAERWLDEPTMSREALASHLTDLLWAGGRAAPRVVPAAAPDRTGNRRPPTVP
ncbi:MAG: putative TetR-family transcriptional regulator, partial [Frankiales bacterium]|nr:putative TetR-family transcriptional regulator [Frankiales bacterium]